MLKWLKTTSIITGLDVVVHIDMERYLSVCTRMSLMKTRGYSSFRYENEFLCLVLLLA